jgi:hypothetical protein
MEHSGERASTSTQAIYEVKGAERDFTTESDDSIQWRSRVFEMSVMFRHVAHPLTDNGNAPSISKSFARFVSQVGGSGGGFCRSFPLPSCDGLDSSYQSVVFPWRACTGLPCELVFCVPKRLHCEISDRCFFILSDGASALDPSISREMSA